MKFKDTSKVSFKILFYFMFWKEREQDKARWSKRDWVVNTANLEACF